MSPPVFVTMKVAVGLLTLLHEPTTDSEGGLGGGVFVGVLVGRARQDPVTLSVTEERNDVLYVTVMVA